MIWIAFDTESTGLEPGSRLVDLAAIAFDDAGVVLDTFAALVHPGMPIPADVIGIHGIDDAAVAASPPAAEVLCRFFNWLPDDAVLIGHNTSFDVGIISWECQRAGLPLPIASVVDTLAMAKSLKATTNCQLQTLVAHYGLTASGDAHRALPDADSVRQYFTLVRHLVPPEPRAWTTPFICPPALPDHLRELPVWVQEGRSVRFAYRNQAGRRSWPELVPFGWAEYPDGRLFLHGRCAWDGQRRTYLACSITNPTRTP